MIQAEFRTWLMEKVREFDKFARAEGEPEPMTLQDWLEMFREYIS